MTYKVQLKKSVQKQLKQIDKKQAERILAYIYLLAEDPYPLNSKPLRGRNDRSMRIGDYRVLYDVDKGVLKILVLGVGHRKDIYG